MLAPLLDDELAADDAVAALRRYSLVSPARDGSVSVHRLVQAVTVDQMPAELARAWRQAAAALIEAALPADPQHQTPGPRSRRCCPTPRLPCPTTATAWGQSPTTSGTAGVIRPPATCTTGTLKPGSRCSAPSTGTP